MDNIRNAAAAPNYGQLGAQSYTATSQAPQSRLSAYCTSMASHAGDAATLQESLQRILMHLTGSARPTTGLAGAVGGPAPVTGLLDDAEKWLTMASNSLHDAREIASQIEFLVSK